ncbi:MAG: arginine--tRNA ligase [Candidatus Rokubacteria bacterium RIFCSPLOWO2_02_FULL_72_37]|nr:MAG: arginine--tRNA ligase [Candidatus Rokubacteria bacterium RIFCSPLOWO2_02_FULL_72_37]
MDDLTDRLTEGVRAALAKAGLPELETCAWEIPRQAEHGDYASNTAMTLARAARRPPRQIADLIVANFPPLAEVERLEVAGPGFINVFLAPAWCTGALRDILVAGASYGRGRSEAGRRVRLEFVSANPTGPLVIVNARAAAVGDSLARLLRAQGAEVTTEYYVNDAGNQFEALARSFEARVAQELGEPATLPENGYPGEYLIDLAQQYRYESGALLADAPARERFEHFGRWAVARMVEGQRRILRDYGVEFDVWSSEQRDVRAAGLPERVLAELAARGLTYEQEGALWFRSTQLGEASGDDKDRVLRRSNGEVTYFAVDVAYHHYVKFGRSDRVINLFGPDHHGYVPRMRAAMQALGHPPGSFEVLIVQLVTLLRDGQPVRMSKRRGEFVLMEELLEEVGRDAARFTFLTRRHDSPLEFDLAVATRQTADNPVYYVQYAHARICSIRKQAAEQGIAVPPLAEIDLGALGEPEELALIKRLLQYPDLVRGAARALEPHRVAYWLQELAGMFHPYYKTHRVIQDDRRLMLARIALCAAIGQVVRNGLGLLGVSAPESM